MTDARLGHDEGQRNVPFVRLDAWAFLHGMGIAGQHRLALTAPQEKAEIAIVVTSAVAKAVARFVEAHERDDDQIQFARVDRCRGGGRFRNAQAAFTQAVARTPAGKPQFPLRQDAGQVDFLPVRMRTGKSGSRVEFVSYGNVSSDAPGPGVFGAGRKVVRGRVACPGDGIDRKSGSGITQSGAQLIASGVRA